MPILTNTIGVLNDFRLLRLPQLRITFTAQRQLFTCIYKRFMGGLHIQVGLLKSLSELPCHIVVRFTALLLFKRLEAFPLCN